MKLPKDIEELLNQLSDTGKEHDAQETVHAKRYLNLESETAELVSQLLRAQGAKRVLEIGTSNGVSATWIAWTIGPEGKLVTIERDPDKQAEAIQNLKGVNLADRVDFKLGDATEAVRGLEGPFDAVFFDADRYSAPEQLALLLQKLAPQVVLLADNARSHPQEIAGYLAAVEALPDFQHSVFTVGKGLSVAVR